MSYRKVFTSIIVLLAVIIGLSLIAPEDTTRSADTSVASNAIEAIREYDAEVQRVHGVIDLPSPCYDLTSEATVADTSPEQVTLQFNTNKPENREGECIQIVDPRLFTLEFNADRSAQLEATLNGQTVPLNLISTSSELFSTTIDRSTTTENIATSTSQATTSDE